MAPDAEQAAQIEPLVKQWIASLPHLVPGLRCNGMGYAPKEGHKIYFHLSGPPAQKDNARQALKSELLNFMHRLKIPFHFNESGNHPSIDISPEGFKHMTITDFRNLEKVVAAYTELAEKTKSSVQR